MCTNLGSRRGQNTLFKRIGQRRWVTLDRLQLLMYSNRAHFCYVRFSRLFDSEPSSSHLGQLQSWPGQLCAEPGDAPVFPDSQIPGVCVGQFPAGPQVTSKYDSSDGFLHLPDQCRLKRTKQLDQDKESIFPHCLASGGMIL